MEPPAPLPISAIEHHEYCPRQCALILVDQVWQDNAHTVRGAFGHRRADSGISRRERGRRVLRAVPLWSERHHLTGRADAIEVHPDGAVVPVEYKIGIRHGRAADLQLCAQAMCLEEMLGQPVPYGFIWYSALRQRRQVAIDEPLRALTLQAIATIRATWERGQLPAAVDDQRCRQCQLVDHCLPTLTAEQRTTVIQAYVQGEVYACGS